MKRNFQTLVVVHQLLVFATVVIQSATEDWITHELSACLDLEPSLLEEAGAEDSGPDVLRTVWWVLTLVSLLASAGLLFFRRWGRRLFVALAFAHLPLMPLAGLYVDVGWTVMVGSLGGVCEGVVIALMYFSPVRRMFGRPRAAGSA